MNNKQNRSITFFLTRSLFLGGGLSNIFSLTGKDAWISGILGILLGIIFLYFINQIKNADKSFIIKVLLILLSIILIIYSLVSLTTLLESYFLVLSPQWFINIPFIVLLIYNLLKKEKSLWRISEILFPICLTVVIVKTILLTSNMNSNYFLPILTVKTSKIFIGAFYYAILSVTPLLIMNNNASFKEDLLNYLIGTISSLIIIISTISVLGPILIKIITFPEYAVLRKIKFLNFIENVENIIACIWLIDLYVLASCSIFNLNRLTNKNITITIVIIITFIFNIFIIKNYNIIILIYKYYITILFILLVSIIVLFKIKKVVKST